MHAYAWWAVPARHPDSQALHAVFVIFWQVACAHLSPDLLAPHMQPSSCKGCTHNPLSNPHTWWCACRARMRMFGEDLKQFMRGAASQRYSLVTYLDLFCYQPVEHRCRWVACRVLRAVSAAAVARCLLCEQHIERLHGGHPSALAACLLLTLGLSELNIVDPRLPTSCRCMSPGTGCSLQTVAPGSVQICSVAHASSLRALRHQRLCYSYHWWPLLCADLLSSSCLPPPGTATPATPCWGASLRADCNEGSLQGWHAMLVCSRRLWTMRPRWKLWPRSGRILRTCTSSR